MPVPAVNRKDRRKIEAILSHLTTTLYERSVLANFGLGDMHRVNGHFVVPDMRIDCLDRWLDRLDEVQTAFTREPRPRSVVRRFR